MLVGISVLLGFMDDLFGTHDDKGFHGHLSALSSGRLTTGGLKALGIGAISAVYAWHIAQGRSAAASGWMETVGTWLLATLVIALSANFINLMDLRPGRALKVYSLLIVIAAPLFAVDASRAFSVYASSLAELGVAPWLSVDTLLAALLMVLVLLGPVAAVWRFDLGEEGMLGDAGSNVMGAGRAGRPAQRAGQRRGQREKGVEKRQHQGSRRRRRQSRGDGPGSPRRLGFSATALPFAEVAAKFRGPGSPGRVLRPGGNP